MRGHLFCLHSGLPPPETAVPSRPEESPGVREKRETGRFRIWKARQGERTESRIRLTHSVSSDSSPVVSRGIW